MNSFLRNVIWKLYNAVSAPVAATQNALAERLQSVRDTASLLYNRMTENMGYGQERLKDIVEKEAEKEQQQKPAAAKEEEEEAKEQRQGRPAVREQQGDDERYDAVAKIKLVYEGKRVKEFRMNGNLNNSNTKMSMDNITSHIEMRTKIIYSFKSEIYRGSGEIKDYSKTLNSPPGMFTSLKEI